MTRKTFVKKKTVNPDTKYNNFTIGLLINYLMIDGKKTKAEKIVYSALETASKKVNKKKIIFFEHILNKLKPQYEVKSRRIGGSTYQIPVEVKSERATSLALKWIVKFSRNRSSSDQMSKKLSDEMYDIFNNRGASIKKKEETHKMAEANQAFSHYRW